METLKVFDDGNCQSCHHKAYMRKYQQKPEVKAKRIKYNQRPEVKAKQREYRQTDKCKAYKKAYYQKKKAIKENEDK
jgi:hypothetical protein